MIRVNMLRSLSLAPGSPGALVGNEVMSPDLQRQAMYRVLVILIFPICLYAYQFVNISSLREQIQKSDAQVGDVQKQIDAFGKIGPRVKQYTEAKAHIDAQLDTIRGLMKNRLREVKALDALQNVVPSQVWLTQIEIKGNSIEMHGYSLSDEGLSTLYAALQNSPVFSQFTPKAQTEEKDSLGNKIKKFQVEFHIGRQEQE